MKVKELDDLVYYASLRAAEKTERDLFKGLIPFLTLINDQLESLEQEVEYIKTTVRYKGGE